MILADKIITLRKKSGLSQEELAEKLGVSRQSISKWEGAQSVPDLNKILAMAQVFEVTTDFLLKDEIETPDYQDGNQSDDVPPVRHVSMEEANKFLTLKEKNARAIALATFLCILAPVFLLMAGGMSECAYMKAYDNALIGFGLILMLLVITVAVVIFIRCGNRSEEYRYIEKEAIETEYGVSGMVKDRKAKFKSVYNKNNLIGTVICILSVIPLFAGAFLNDDFIAVCCLCATLIAAGVGVTFFVRVGVVQSAFQQLLQEGDFIKAKKGRESLASAIGTVYWLLTTAIYVAVSFFTNNWNSTWVVWAVAAVLFPAVLVICNIISGKKN